jgi:hypothetical protein
MHEKFRKPCLIAPLGYTNIFAESVSRLLQTGAEADGSLFDLSSQKIQTKFIDVCFVGQKGNVERQKFVKDAIGEMSKCEINPNFKVVVREEFGGVRNSLEKTTWCDEYVEILNRASVSICPPGNYSGVTYRFAESLLLNCYPLQLNEVLTDPNWEPYIELDSTPFWECKLQEILNLDYEGRVASTRELREAYLRKLSDLNYEILSLR